jgi:hypothetical protein
VDGFYKAGVDFILPKLHHNTPSNLNFIVHLERDAIGKSPRHRQRQQDFGEEGDAVHLILVLKAKVGKFGQVKG